TCSAARGRERASVGRRLGALGARSVLRFAGAAAATVAWILLAVNVVQGRTDALDRRLPVDGHPPATPTVDAVIATISALGTAPHIVGIIFIVALWAIERRFTRAAVVLLATYVVVDGVNHLMKALVGRQRPFLFAGAELHASYSFPSGHAMVSTAVY